MRYLGMILCAALGVGLIIAGTDPAKLPAPQTAQTAPKLSAAIMPKASTDPNDLTACEVFNILYQQDGQLHYATWTNTAGRPLKIKKVYVWTGCSGGTVADVGCYLTRISDGSPVAYYQWDHYAPPISPTGTMNDFGSSYMLLAPGDGLQLRYGSGAAWLMSQHTVVIWCN